MLTATPTRVALAALAALTCVTSGSAALPVAPPPRPLVAPAPPPRLQLDYDTPFVRKMLTAFRGDSIEVHLRTPDGRPDVFAGRVITHREADTPAGRVTLVTVRFEKGSRQFRLADVKRLRFTDVRVQHEFGRAMLIEEGIDLQAIVRAEWDIYAALNKEGPGPPPASWRLRLEETPAVNGHPALAELLPKARGERTEFQVALADGKTETRRDTIVGVERQKVAGKATEFAVVTYFGDAGLQTVALASVRRIRFTNPEAERLFRPELDDMARGRWSRYPAAPAPRPKPERQP